MKLHKANVQCYRSIIETGWFDIEDTKTILVGPNEAGKTILLQALQQINPPEDVPKFDALRDYPRSKYNDITNGTVDPSKTTIVETHFTLELDDQDQLPEDYKDCIYITGRRLDNSFWHQLSGGPQAPEYSSLKNDLIKISALVDTHLLNGATENSDSELPSIQLTNIFDGLDDSTLIDIVQSKKLMAWLNSVENHVDKNNEIEKKLFEKNKSALKFYDVRDSVLQTLKSRLPVFVYFSNYFRVRPLIHLEHLASRIDTGILDEDQYDYGNLCLLKLLGFSARELSNLGKAPEPEINSPELLSNYRAQLDKRSYQLNAASVRLTDVIRRVWFPDPERSEADRLRILADGQYLKVVVEDDLGVDIELDQRSGGFQWLVSFFVVFFAEVSDKYKNAILLLDEPGLSLHGLKQRDFRVTISRLAENNQTLYTTHSPFLVGPDELDLVRVVEMTDRNIGTKVHTTISASDSVAILPLQEALGYDLAQSLFSQTRNLVLEGLTDYWYLDAIAQLLRESNYVNLNEKIALIPAGNAGKVVYYATILHAHNLKVAAILDSDSAGDQAAQQDVLVHTLGNSNILRTKDFYNGPVAKPEIEDLLRETLIQIAITDLGWDVSATASNHPSQPIVDIFNSEITSFSKYKLAKAFLRWTREHEASDLLSHEQKQWNDLITQINKVLK